MNSTEQVPSPLPLTREQILLLNDGSRTLEQAAAKFNVDLRRFRAVLEKENIFVWNQVDGTTRRIHGGNYRITMLVSVMEYKKLCIVKGWFPFESVIRIIEEELKLTCGCYKLSYKHPDASVGGDVLIKTDHDWHNAAKVFRPHAYFMPLDLKKIPGAGAKNIPDAEDDEDAGNVDFSGDKAGDDNDDDDDDDVDDDEEDTDDDDDDDLEKQEDDYDDEEDYEDDEEEE